MVTNNLVVVSFGLVFITLGIFTVSSNQGFGYSMIVFGIILIVITLIKYLWEKGKF